ALEDFGALGFARTGQRVDYLDLVVHLGARNHNNAVSGQAVAPAEVNVVAAAWDCRVESAQVFKDFTADEHASRGDGEVVAASVVLPLVDFVDIDQGQALGLAVHAQADFGQVARVVDVQQLAAGDGYRLGCLDGASQLFQCVRSRHGVIVDNP